MLEKMKLHPKYLLLFQGLPPRLPEKVHKLHNFYSVMHCDKTVYSTGRTSQPYQQMADVFGFEGVHLTLIQPCLKS